MWSKLSSVLKPKEDTGSEVLNKVLEQHPNLSVFHHSNDSDGLSPSVHSKKNMFKRLSKPLISKDEVDRKPKNSVDFDGDRPKIQHQRSSFDLLRPNTANTLDTSRPSRKRPSLDLLKDPDNNNNSVRSILRDKNTPSSGQSVRFFAKNDFKLITPDNSVAMSDALLDMDKPQPPLPKNHDDDDDDDDQPLIRPSSSPSDGSPFSKASNSRPRPKLAGLFDEDSKKENVVNSSASLSNAMPASLPNDFSNIFNTSAQLDIPAFPLSRLDFNVDAQTFGSSFDMSANDMSYVVKDENLDSLRGQMTSTPPKTDLLKKDVEDVGTDESLVIDEEQEEVEGGGVVPALLDESIFHWKEKKKVLSSPPPIHERSQSFSFGQTVFYSMMNKLGDSKYGEEIESEAAYPSSDVRGNESSGLPGPSPEQSKTRTRAMSDTAFQEMLKMSSPKTILPEAEINDESGADLIVYSGAPSEPDPFSANATTYYTPQVNIPVTPPRGIPKHLRTTSKEENFIISLQTQLSLKTELCAQFEIDLKARDELVEILGKKLGDVEKDEGKRKVAVRGWRKRVQELERNCRLLEEAMDRSRQESLERSVMDEASGEALRMLHRQIQGLENDKGESARREERLKGEVEQLQQVVKATNEALEDMKERLMRGEERERELKEGLREAKEQMEMMGDCSVVFPGGVDIEELEREREQRESEATQRLRMREIELAQEVEEVRAKMEWTEVEKRGVEEHVEGLNLQLKTKEEEWKVLKAEVEAQWQRTEGLSERVAELERENGELVIERDALRGDAESLEEQIGSLEREWRDCEERKNELEDENREVWRVKDEIEQEQVKLEDCLRQERDSAERLGKKLHQTESRVEELEQEKAFTDDRIGRFEENSRKQVEEVRNYTERFIAGESEAERLREELNRFKRDHERLLSDQARLLSDAIRQKEMMEKNLEEVVTRKVELQIEAKDSKERESRLVAEVEELRKEVRAVKMDSADKEVKMVQIMKRADRDKEDLVGLEIALESKQQELELIKRKLNVRGTGGSTPALSSKVLTSRHRRDSSVFTATPAERRLSALSLDDNDDDVSALVNSETKKTKTKNVLGKSHRGNNASLDMASSTSSTTKGAMGPPPQPSALKSRPSLIGTQTPTPTMNRRGLNRSASAIGMVRGVVSPVPSTPSPSRSGFSSSVVNNNPKRPSGLIESGGGNSGSISAGKRKVVVTGGSFRTVPASSSLSGAGGEEKEKENFRLRRREPEGVLAV